MADFKKALAYVLLNEGGWSKDNDDPGGATSRGITLQTAKHFGIDTEEKLKNLRQFEIENIYKKGYWRFDNIQDQVVATKLMDMCVNFGFKTAIKLLQVELNGLGFRLIVDGIYGPQTESALNQSDQIKLALCLCFASKERYLQLVRSNSSLNKFLNGWINRAVRLPAREM